MGATAISKNQNVDNTQGKYDVKRPEEPKKTPQGAQANQPLKLKPRLSPPHQGEKKRKNRGISRLEIKSYMGDGFVR